MTNVTLLCEEQAKYIAELVSRMAADGQTEVEPTAEAVAVWRAAQPPTMAWRIPATALLAVVVALSRRGEAEGQVLRAVIPT